VTDDPGRKDSEREGGARGAPTPSAVGGRRRTLPLSLVIGGSIGVLVAVAVAAVLAVALGAGERNTRALLEDKIALSLTLMATRLADHQRPPADQIAYLASAIERGALDPGDPAALQAAFADALEAVGQLHGVAWWPAEGLRRVGVARRTEGDGLVVESGTLEDTPQARRLTAALSALDRPTWADPVHIPTIGRSAFTRRHPVRRDGRTVGALIGLVTIDDLSAFLADLGADLEDLTPFVIDDAGRLMAHPGMAGGVAGLSAERVLPAPDEIGDPVLAAWIAGEGEVPAIRFAGVDSRLVFPGGEEHIVLTQQRTTPDGAPVTLGLHASTAVVGAEIIRLVRAAVVGLILLVVAVLVGLRVGHHIARPIRRLADRADSLGALDFARTAPLPPSRLSELDRQARAFNAMLAGLAWFETYVPRTLVRRLMAARETGIPVRGAVASEEREMTVLFTDIAGFTEQAERLSAGETAAFLNGHFARLAACIEAEDGTIDKYLGDGLMAFWGAPEPAEDHAARACRAAVAIARCIAEDNRRARSAAGAARDPVEVGGAAAAGGAAAEAGTPPGARTDGRDAGNGVDDDIGPGAPVRPALPVRLRIGVHSGPMVVGNIGAPDRVDYTIVGDAVNTGQRLEQLGKTVDAADDDTVVLISAAVAERLPPDFAPAPEPAGNHRLTGRAEGVTVWRLRG